MPLCKCGCGGEVPIAKKTSLKKGHIKGQPMQFIHGHNRRKEVELKKCLYCGKEIPRSIFPSGKREDRKTYSKKKFCSPKCASDYRSGPRASNWSGGKRIDKNGYIYILVGKEHHLSDPYGYALEHRVIAEEVIGRKLRKDEVVHHADGDRHNNKPENLIVMSKSNHRALHNAIRNGREWNEYPKK